MITISFNKIKFKSATGLTCSTENWSNSTYRTLRKEPEYLFINHILGEFTQRINSSLLEYKLMKTNIDDNSIKSMFLNIRNEIVYKGKNVNNQLNELATDDSNAFISDFEKFITLREDDPNYSEGIIKNYKKNFKHIKQYIAKNRLQITYDGIDNEFYIKFIKYLSEDLSLQRNTVGNIIKTLKTFLNWSFNEGYHSSTKYMKVLKVWKEKADVIVLDDMEIKKIEDLDLTDNNSLDKVRDIFLICLFTGLRFGDYDKLQPAHINLKRRDIRLVTNKTKDAVGIPIDRRLEVILLKYPDLSLPKMSNQKVNEYIKEVGEKAGIKEEVIKIFRTGNKTQEIAIPKYELISMHTARRTWNTKAEKSKRNTFAIMRATGHKNIDVHAGYVKFGLDEAIEVMRGMWD